MSTKQVLKYQLSNVKSSKFRQKGNVQFSELLHQILHCPVLLQVKVRLVVFHDVFRNCCSKLRDLPQWARILSSSMVAHDSAQLSCILFPKLRQVSHNLLQPMSFATSATSVMEEGPLCFLDVFHHICCQKIPLPPIAQAFPCFSSWQNGAINLTCWDCHYPILTKYNNLTLVQVQLQQAACSKRIHQDYLRF